ncbi:MAG: TraB/GumN family protein [Rubricoccaceae bacterium]
MRFVLPAALLLLASPTWAQTEWADTTDTRRPPLFLLEDADSKVYLFGSIHVVPASSLPLPRAIESAFDEVEVVAFELDLDAAEAESSALAHKGINGVSVAEALTEDQMKRLDGTLGRLGVPTGAVDTFEPWLVALMLTTFDLQKRGEMAEGGVDRYLFDRAQALGREIIPFETAALQTDVFDGMKLKDQVAYLMSTLDGMDSGEDGYAKLLDTWSSGDDDGLATLMADGTRDTPSLEARLLTDRNRAWVPQVEALLARDQDAMVVVGAGHLVGDNSVVAMLRAAGYEVVRQ